MAKSHRFFFAVFFSLLFFPQSLLAAVFVVTPTSGGSGDPACQADPNNCNLQEALNVAAGNGADDTIQLATGVYNTADNGPGVFLFASGENFSLVIQGQGTGNTILDGGGSGGTQIMLLAFGGTSGSFQVIGVTFRNGEVASTGAGLSLVSQAGDILVQDCEFLNNVSTNGAGGLAVAYTGTGVVRVQGNFFQANQGGASFGPGAAVINATGGGPIDLIENDSIGNIANGASSDAFSPGGIFVQTITNGSLTVEGNLFDDNTGAAGPFCPGAMFAQGFGSLNSVTGNQFLNNRTVSTTAFSSGAVFYQSFIGTSDFSGNILDNNTGGTSSFSPGGAFIQAFDDDSNFSENTFSRNISKGDISSPGGMFFQSFGGTVTMNSNTFLHNQTNSGPSLNAGGWSSNISNGALIMTNNIVAGNSSSAGVGGVEVSGADFPLDIINNTLTGNTGGANGGGILVGAQSDVTTLNIYNNIVFGNSTTGTGQDIFVENSSGPAALINLFNNDFGEFCLSTPAGCDFTTLANQGANIQLDPLFIDTANDDYRLQGASPAIDQGTASAPNLPATDHDGNPRIFGPAPDMGALEAVPLINVDPLSHDFGDIFAGTVVVTISNLGSLDLGVTGMTLADPNFSLDVNGGPDPCGSETPTLAPGESCTVLVTFTPTTDGVVNGVLVISSNDPVHPEVQVLLTGIGGNQFVFGAGCALEAGSSSGNVHTWVMISIFTGIFFLSLKRKAALRN